MLSKEEWQAAIEREPHDHDTYRRMDLLRSALRTAVQCPKIDRALVEVGLRLPEEVLDEVEELHFLIFYAAASEPMKLNLPGAEGDANGCWLLALASDLEEASYEEVVGTIAHELAHILLDHDNFDDSPNAEFDACAKAIEWGFAEETLVIVRVQRDGESDGGPAWQDCANRISELEAMVGALEEGEEGD